MLNICNVITITGALQVPVNKPHSNRTWLGVIDVAGVATHVILKEEAPSRLNIELLALDLANLLNIPHIAGWLASVDQSSINYWGISSSIVDPLDVTRRLVFASKLSSGSPLASLGGLNQTATTRYLAHRDALTIFVFDEFLGNIDRVYENVMEDSSQFLAFDHDKILFGHCVEFSKLDGLASKPCSLCLINSDVTSSSHYIESSALALATSWQRKLSSPNPIQILQKLLSAKLLSLPDANALENFFVNRLKYLPSLIETYG